MVEHGPLLLEGVLGEEQVHGGAVDLAREGVDLAVELVDDAVRGLLLALEIRELVRKRVHLRLEPLELLLDLGPLAADVLQATLVVPKLLVEGLRPLGRQRSVEEKGVEKRREKEA